MTRVLIIIALLVSLMACTKEIEYEIPREDPMISIDVRLHANSSGNRVDSTIAILSTTVYSLSSEQPQLDSVYQVSLLENNGLVATFQPQNLAGSGFFYYETEYQPQLNNHYRVNASAEGLPDAWGDCFIKPGVQVDTAHYEIEGIEARAFITFSDPADTVDYYQIIVRRYTNELFFDPLYITTTDPLAQSSSNFETPLENEGEISGNSIFLSDETFNGRKKTFAFTFEDDIRGLLTYDYLDITVRRIDEDYFRHVRSRELAEDVGQNPFAEPVQVFSNVNNGVGAVLCGSEVTTRVRRF